MDQTYCLKAGCLHTLDIRRVRSVERHVLEIDCFDLDAAIETQSPLLGWLGILSSRGWGVMIAVTRGQSPLVPFTVRC